MCCVRPPMRHTLRSSTSARIGKSRCRKLSAQLPHASVPLRSHQSSRQCGPSPDKLLTCNFTNCDCLSGTMCTKHRPENKKLGFDIFAARSPHKRMFFWWWLCHAPALLVLALCVVFACFAVLKNVAADGNVTMFVSSNTVEQVSRTVGEIDMGTKTTAARPSNIGPTCGQRCK